MKIKLIIFCLLLFALKINAQDFHFSQYDETPLLINPALTGSFSGTLRGHVYFRNQWSKVINPYETFGASFDARLSFSKKKKASESGCLAFGISIMKDKTGKSELSATQSLFSIAYHQRVHKYGYLSGAIQGGITQKTINYSNLLWDNQYDPAVSGFNPALPNKEMYLVDGFSYNDVSAGVLYNFKTDELNSEPFDRINLKTGFAYYYFTKTDKSFTEIYNNPMYARLVFHVSSLLGIYRSGFSMIPSLMYERQGPNTEFVVGTGVKYTFRKLFNVKGLSDETGLTLGYLVRTSDAFIPYMAIEFMGINLGMSYDVNFSDLKKATKRLGGFEINIRYIKL